MIDAKVGDTVIRNLAGVIMPLVVTDVTDDLIICGGDHTDHIGWWFDKASGVEVDEEIGWGPKFGRSGSFITVKKAD